MKHQLVENHVLRWRDRYREAHQFDRPSAIEPAAGKRTPAGEIDIRAGIGFQVKDVEMPERIAAGFLGDYLRGRTVIE